jgi:hypothetical protein
MAGSRWRSFVAPLTARGRIVRHLHEEANPRHRLRVEHDAETLLIHLSDEDGGSWTTIAVSRGSRELAIGRGPRQIDAAQQAYEALHRVAGKQRPARSATGKKRARRPAR